MLIEIKDIYKYQKEEQAPMLSGYTADFWAPYRNNYAYYDRIFKKKYASFFPYDQTGDVEDVAEDFSEDVKAWLMMNDKRYSELYRINTITDDEKYSLTDNVYEHEIIEKDTETAGTNIKGSETITDATVNAYGQQSDSESKSASFASRTDTEDKSASFASRTDTEDKEHVYGSQLVEVDGTVTQGAGEKTTTNSVSAFNDNGWSANDKSFEEEAARTETTNMDTTNGAHTDTEDNTYVHGSHTDTEDNTYVHGAHTDTETNSYTKGSHTDNLSNTRTDSQRTDTNSGTGSEDIERTRTGNIGVKTVPQMLDDQKMFWVSFSFYDFIFGEIARELLRGC